MQNVVFITDLHVGSHVAELEGICERARDFGWRVVEIEYERTNRPLGDYLRTWRPVGCILSCSALTTPLSPEIFKRLPTVYLDPDEGTLRRGLPCVASDPEPLADIAFRELASLDCASYGYVGWNEPTAWSEGRRRAFERLAKRSGRPYASFTEQWTSKDRLRFHRQLAEWLQGLPKPLGIFAANDDTASQVAEACGMLSLRSPEDVALVGVDNFELICENAVTSLTSIEIDFHAAGRLATELLHRVVTNAYPKPDVRRFGAGRLVRRQSTRRLATCDAHVARALETIRREACLGLHPADVIKLIGQSRRSAEQRFRKAVGHSILTEINELRLARAMTLLERPNYPIAMIAGDCGWQSDAYLKRLFKRTTGMTMREWRNRKLAEADGQTRQ